MSSKFKPALATNLHATSYFGDKFAVGFDYDGARYHIWFRDGRDEEVLYKNCPLGLKSTDAGYYEPRKLDLSKPFGLAVLTWIEPRFEALTAQAKALCDAEAAAEQALHKEAKRAEQVRAAAPDLAEALQGLLAEVDAMTARVGWSGNGHREKARAALAKAGV
jgi:hypothetical protein